MTIRTLPGAILALTLATLVGCGGGISFTGEDDAETDTSDPDALDVTTDVEDEGDVVEETDVPLGCVDDAECDDGNPCNGQETCGDDGTCEDGTPLDDGTECDVDGGDGTCQEGVCVPVTCGDGELDAGEECDDANAESGDGCEATCLFSCHDDAECDDANVCTDDTCAEGGTGRLCNHENNTAPCDDGDECTDPDVCAEGECTPGDPICGCTTDSDCEEFEDGDLCNGTLICEPETGNCVVDPETLVTCPPTSTLCDTRVCDPDTGVCNPEYRDAGTPCETDDDPCTIDQCDDAGSCTHVEDDCDDGNPCTDDSCDSTTGCIHDVIDGCCTTDSDCDDGDACTTDSCDGATGTCVTGTVDCDDGDLCTIDLCDPSTGCVYEPEDCDDGSDCTTDVCVPDTGCMYSYLSGPCEDGDPCTGPDECNTTGDCIPGPPLPVWYEDADGDGFGNPDSTTCAETVPTGFVDNAEDCCDSEADANPDQTTFFADPFICAGSTTESWDYNCGGADYQRWQEYGNCQWAWWGCDYNEGWDRGGGWTPLPIPDCGDSGDFVSGCTSGCDEVFETRRQECI